MAMEVENFTRVTVLTAAPAVSAAAYASGNCVGGLIALPGIVRFAGYNGIIEAVTATFAGGAVPSLDVIFFNANPTGSTITDKTAIAVVAADVGKIIGVAHINDWTLAAASTMSFGQALGLNMPFQPQSNATTIYAAVVARAAFTPPSTSDFTLAVKSL